MDIDSTAGILHTAALDAFEQGMSLTVWQAKLGGVVVDLRKIGEQTVVAQSVGDDLEQAVLLILGKMRLLRDQ